MIHVIHTLRANLIHKEVEGKILDVIGSKRKIAEWNLQQLVSTPNLFRVDRMLRRFERLRRQRWAPWKDKR